MAGAEPGGALTMNGIYRAYGNNVFFLFTAGESCFPRKPFEMDPQKVYIHCWPILTGGKTFWENLLHKPFGTWTCRRAKRAGENPGI